LKEVDKRLAAHNGANGNALDDSHELSEAQAQGAFISARGVAARLHNADAADPICIAVIAGLGFKLPDHFIPRGRYSPGAQPDRVSLLVNVGDNNTKRVSLARVKCLERPAA
jgi:hypothetical protein